ncbi:MAG: hypothetical protein V4819_20190 [Verrucomicrobiota bacterium]
MERSATEHGYLVKFFAIDGYAPDGRRIRKRFKTRDEADGELAILRVSVTNEKTALHSVTTRLSSLQVSEAEAAFNRLGKRYSLGDAVEYYLKHFAEPDERKELPEAIRVFLDDRARAGVRERSLTQLRATLEAFSAWLTLDLLPDNLALELKRVKAKLANSNRATLREILLAIPQIERAEIRKIAGENGAASDAVPPSKFFAALSAALRKKTEAAAITLDGNFQPSNRVLVAALVEAVKPLPVPAVHEVTSDDVRRYLRALKAKDGKAAAARKTWNNYRADIHAFFAWTSDKQRRWTGENPVTDIEKFKDSRGLPSALTVGEVRELMNYVATYKKGKIARYFALALFAGLRTGPKGELDKLAAHRDVAKYIDLARGVIHVQPEVSKTAGSYRQIIIRPNLAAWLLAFPGEIYPANHDRLIKHVRSRFHLGHDVLRHTFFSMHVAAFKSIGEAALEGGNTEAIVRKHYLNLSSYQEGEQFWSIFLSARSSLALLEA